MASSFSQVPAKAINAPKPFKVEVPNEELAALRNLLKSSRLPKPTYESLQEDRRFGVSYRWMSEAKTEWEGFDWRKSEAYINTFSHFSVPVTVRPSTFNIHFVALFSSKPNAIPIALFHGWPGSFLEFLPMLSLLQVKYTPATLPYHIIVPSLPGYAFSGTPPLDRNFNTKDIATVMDQLMQDLGFGDGYVVQGGDIGSRVARLIGSISGSCKAVHVNFCPVLSPPAAHPVSSLSVRDQQGIKRGEEFLRMGGGYLLEHATRPATIGLALDSSPLALLAWIGEKFLAWSDEKPRLETILESVSLYWFTESMGRGVFPYRGRFDLENRNWPSPGPGKLAKPTGYSNFPKELIPSPKSWAAAVVNLVFYREHERGGHFAALEQPELLLSDIEDFVKEVWKT